ncbi:MAG: L-threonylcarbamoyladenylate synthase [Erythrobacter sp.]
MSGKNVTEVVQADPKGIALAAQILESGGVVAVPTETVYGLAARADSPDAVAKIYAAKGRPDFNPLIVHVHDQDHAAQYAEWGPSARRAVQAIWPGPITLVVPAKPDANLAPAVTAGLNTVAVRSPGHPVMRQLLGAVDFPLAAPSANRSGFISPTTAAHVLSSLDGRIDLVLDGGPTQAGVESTILAIRDGGVWEELRPGPIDLSALHHECFGTPMPAHKPSVGAKVGVEAPGQLASHYAPGKPIRLNALDRNPQEFVIGFGSIPGDVTLSASGNVEEAAARLYDCLHVAAASDFEKIAIAPVPKDGIGRAINDRLGRAAAPID